MPVLEKKHSHEAPRWYVSALLSSSPSPRTEKSSDCRDSHVDVGVTPSPLRTGPIAAFKYSGGLRPPAPRLPSILRNVRLTPRLFSSNTVLLACHRMTPSQRRLSPLRQRGENREKHDHRGGSDGEVRYGLLPWVLYLLIEEHSCHLTTNSFSLFCSCWHRFATLRPKCYPHSLN